MADSYAVEEPTFTMVGKGYTGAEGPVFNQNGEFYMVASEVEVDGKSAGQILQVNTSTGESTVISSPSIDGYGGIPSGCQFDKYDNLWVADIRLGILKVDVKKKTFKQMFKMDSDGNVMQGCNDCSLDYNGNLWVTAPAGDIAPAEERNSNKEPFGSVYCMTSDGMCVKVATGYLYPNGLAVKHSSEGKPQVLIVAETETKSLWAFDITAPGKVTNKRLWGKLPGENAGGPDGMDFDAEGRLLVAHWGGGHIEVFGPDGGVPQTRIKCPFQATSNVHFRPGTAEVYVTELTNHALWTFTWKSVGRKEACEM